MLPRVVCARRARALVEIVHAVVAAVAGPADAGVLVDGDAAVDSGVRARAGVLARRRDTLVDVDVADSVVAHWSTPGIDGGRIVGRALVLVLRDRPLDAEAVGPAGDAEAAPGVCGNGGIDGGLDAARKTEGKIGVRKATWLPAKQYKIVKWQTKMFKFRNCKRAWSMQMRRQNS